MVEQTMDLLFEPISELIFEPTVSSYLFVFTRGIWNHVFVILFVRGCLLMFDFNAQSRNGEKEHFCQAHSFTDRGLRNREASLDSYKF